MPRGPRLDYAGILHHVRFRGIEGRKIFLEEGDRIDFLGRLETSCEDQQAFVYAQLSCGEPKFALFTT